MEDLKFCLTDILRDNQQLYDFKMSVCVSSQTEDPFVHLSLIFISGSSLPPFLPPVVQFCPSIPDACHPKSHYFLVFILTKHILPI